MTLSDKSSKLILSTALFTLAGSIVFVSGTGLAQGATSTDKAISTLKKQIKTLQERVQTLEDSPELLQGEPRPEGPQGPQGVIGPQGPAGTMTGLKKKSIRFLQGKQLLSSDCPGTLSEAFGFSDVTVVTEVSAKTDWQSNAITGVRSTTTSLRSCSLEVYTP